MNSITIVLVYLVFCVMQQRLDALTCYICDRGSDGCGPSLLTTGRGVVTTSSSTSPACCIKLVAISNANSISRNYAPSESCTEGSTTDSNSADVYQYVCTTELCNEGSMRKASFLFAMILAFIGMLLIP